MSEMVISLGYRAYSQMIGRNDARWYVMSYAIVASNFYSLRCVVALDLP